MNRYGFYFSNFEDGFAVKPIPPLDADKSADGKTVPPAPAVPQRAARFRAWRQIGDPLPAAPVTPIAVTTPIRTAPITIVSVWPVSIPAAPVRPVVPIIAVRTVVAVITVWPMPITVAAPVRPVPVPVAPVHVGDRCRLFISGAKRRRIYSCARRG